MESMQAEQIDMGKMQRRRTVKTVLVTFLVTALGVAISTFFLQKRVYQARLDACTNQLTELQTTTQSQAQQIQTLTHKNTELQLWVDQMQWSSTLWDRGMMARYLARNKFIYLSQAEQIVDHIFAYADTYQLDPLFMFVFYFSESGGDPRAVSVAKARGLTQVLLKHRGKDIWGKYLTKHGIIETEADLFDPKVSAHAGSHIFRHYLNDSIKALPKGTSYSTILDRTVKRYKGGDDSKYMDRIRDIFGHYSMWVLVQHANADNVFSMATLQVPSNETETEPVNGGAEPLASTTDRSVAAVASAD